MSKVLITGGAGFIGYHLSKLLHTEGHEIVILDNFIRREKDRDFKEFILQKGVTFKELDLTKTEQIMELGNDFDYIYHLAAIIGVKYVLNEPERVLFDNMSMFFYLLPLAKKQNNLKRFVFTSTSEVYDGTLKHFNLQLPAPENAPLTVPDLNHPRTTYMLSKVYGESICIQSGLPYTIIRPFNFYGPRMGLAHVIPEVMQRIYNTPEYGVLEVINLDHKRTFCFIDDAIKMMKHATESNNFKNEILNVGVESPEIAVAELVDIMLKVMGREIVIKEKFADVGSPIRRCPDMSKLRGYLQNNPTVQLEDGISKTYKWYEANVF